MTNEQQQQQQMMQAQYSDDHLEKIFAYVDANHSNYTRRLADAVAIPSVSAWAESRDDTIRMVHWTEKLFREELGCQTRVAENPAGMETFENGTVKPYPPVLQAWLTDGNNEKPTVLVYGHLDVQPAQKSDGWDTEPFVLTEIEGKMYGRGSTDDKGPVLCWFNCIEAYQKLDIELPVNVKFVLEALEETNSMGLDQLLLDWKDNYLKDVDYVCISDNYWLGKKRPCLTYGLRGISCFQLEVQGSVRDLHSGVYGGSVHEPMVDLVKIMSKLVDENGKILVPGLCDHVTPLTEEERATYDPIDFCEDQFKSDAGVNRLMRSGKQELLMARWRYPSLSLHGIEGAFDQPGFKTVIPRRVVGKFSVRLVPNMTPEDVRSKVEAYVKSIHSGPNRVQLFEDGGAEAWVADFNTKNFAAGKMALKKVFGVEPDLTREGGSIPVTLTIHKCLGKSIMLLPVGACDDGAHSQNEKLDKSNYFNGIKAMAAYFKYLAELHKEQF